MVSIEEMKNKRFLFLHRLYEMTEGDRFKGFGMYEIGQKLCFEKDLTDKIVRYLIDKKLIESTLDGVLRITHDGICEVEEALPKPDEPPVHFPPPNIIIGPVINSPIQQGSPQATQEVIIGKDKCKELEELLQSLKESIDKLGLEAQAKSNLQTNIQTIEAQMSSSTPKTKIITECIGSIRRILEGVAGNVLAVRLIETLNGLFGT